MIKVLTFLFLSILLLQLARGKVAWAKKGHVPRPKNDVLMRRLFWLLTVVSSVNFGLSSFQYLKDNGFI